MDEIIYSFYWIKSLKSNVYFTLATYINSFRMLGSHVWLVATVLDSGFWIRKEGSRASAVEPRLEETFDSIVVVQILCLRNRKERKGTEHFCLAFYLRLLKFKYHSKGCPTSRYFLGKRGVYLCTYYKDP